MKWRRAIEMSCEAFSLFVLPSNAYGSTVILIMRLNRPCRCHGVISAIFLRRSLCWSSGRVGEEVYLFAPVLCEMHSSSSKGIRHATGQLRAVGEGWYTHQTSREKHRASRPNMASSAKWRYNRSRPEIIFARSEKMKRR